MNQPSRFRKNGLGQKIADFNFPFWLKENLLPLTFLIFLTLTVYANSLDNEFVADDLPAIVQNAGLGRLSAVFQNPLGFLRPLLYFFSYQAGGLNPFSYHLFSLLFHLGNVLLLYLLVFLLVEKQTALISASLFSVHPVLVEAVSWISGAVHSQYSFFLLWALLFYLFSACLNSKESYFLSLGAFLLALLFSEKAIVFPLILLAFFLAFEEKGRRWKKVVPFFAISLVWAFLYLGAVSERMTALEAQYYQSPQLLNPLAQIPVAISSYLELIFWPKDLTLYHSEMSFSKEEYFRKLTVFLAFLGSIFIAWLKDRRIFFWLSLFVVSLLPTLLPLGLSWIVAERYVYLGAAGVLVSVALLVQKGGEVLKNRKIGHFLLAFLLVILSLRTVLRNQDWQNQDALWLSAEKTSPSSPQNHNNLGDLYGRRGELDRAVEHFQKAVELQPNYGDAYHNLANTYGQMGRIDLAIANYQKALEFNPRLWQSYQNLAAIYFTQEEFAAAAQALARALLINPANAELHFSLGLVYLKLGQENQADQEFQEALELNPRFRDLLESLPRHETK